MDQLAALRALRGVVELGGFTAAGAALGVSHTAVSRQISQLECLLGAQLLNRSTRGLDRSSTVKFVCAAGWSTVAVTRKRSFCKGV